MSLQVLSENTRAARKFADSVLEKEVSNSKIAFSGTVRICTREGKLMKSGIQQKKELKK